MNRRIQTKQLQVAGGGTDVDTYFDKVVKYIPADIVGAWVAVTGLVRGSADVPAARVLWIAFGVGVLLTALWTLRQTTVANRGPATTQTLIGVGAFAVWVFALGEPFSSLAFYRPLYGSLLLILYTLAVGLINPKE